MAKPNYGFAKRQREIAKKQKKEEKRLRKAAENAPPIAEDHSSAEAEGTPLPVPSDPQAEPPRQ